MRKARRLTLLIVVLPLLAITAGSVVFVMGLSRAALRRLPEVLRAAAAERINGDVKIGKIEVLPARGLVLTDVAISGVSPDKPIVRVPTVRIAYSLADIALRKRDPIASIRRIEILKPDVFLERTPEGRWNIANILKPQPPSQPLKLRAEIRVKSGRVTICDRAPNPARPEQNILRSINGRADLSGIPVVRCSVSGKGDPGKLERFAAKGRYNLTNHSFSADLDVLGASASGLSAYSKKTGLNVSSGTARIGLRVSRPGEDKPLQYAGAIRLRSVEARVPQLRSPVRDLDGDIRIRTGVVSVRLKGKVGSTPFVLSGQVLDPSHPRLALEATSDSVNFREVASLTGWAKQLGRTTLPQNGRFRARVLGPAMSPKVDFALEMPSLSHPDCECHSILVNGTYADRRISIRQASAGMYGGLIELSGDIAVSGSPRGMLEGRVSSIPLGRIPFLRERQFAATSTGELDASWGPGSVLVDYQGTLNEGRIKGVQFDGGRLSAAYGDGIIVLKQLSVEALGGTVTASGQTALDGDLKFKAAGSDINLASVKEMYWSAPTVGRLNFTGELTGTFQSPVFNGDIEAQRVMVSGIGTERIAGSLSASREAIESANMVIYEYPGTVTLTGRIRNPLAETPSLDLRIRADSLDTDKLTGALGRSALTEGEASAELIVSGTLRDPKAEGTLHIEGGSYCDVPIDSLDAQIACGLNSLQLDELTVRSGASCLTASGEISKNRRISMRFSGDQVSLDKFASLFQPYALASGDMTLSGSITGEADAPHVEAMVECEKPVINGQEFQRLSGRISWREPALVFSDFSLSQATGKCMIPKLTYDSVARTYTLTAQAQDIRGKTVVALLDASPALKQSSDHHTVLRRLLDKLPRPLDGMVNGSVTGTVQLTNEDVRPDLRVEATGADMTFGSSSIKSVRMEGSWQNGIAKLETLEAMDGDTNVSATASFGPSDEVALSVDAHSLPVELLKQWLDMPQNISGKADVTIVAGGKIDAPELDASVEVVELKIGRAGFDRLRSRLSANKERSDTNVGKTQTPGRIDIDDLTLILGDHGLGATGYVPMDWRRLTIPTDGSVLLESHLDRGSLELLSTVGGIDAETGPNGAFEGLIRLSGTVQSPKLDGDLAWRDGRFRIPRIAEPLQNISARLRLAGDKLSIEEFTGASAEGGSFSISGEVALADLKPVLDIGLKTDGLRISGENMSSTYGESVKARLDSDLKLAGKWQSPRVTGRVDVPEGSIVLPAKGGQPSERGARRVDPTFDIAASLGRDVQFRSARLRGPLVGQLAVKGSMSMPVLEGTLDISGGDIVFPMRELRILPGSTVTLRTGPSQRPIALLDMRAQTRLTTLSFLGQRKRYTVTMSAQGPLDSLNPTFSSSPPGLTDQMIVALLTGQGQLEQILARNGSRSVGQELSGLFSTAMMPTVFKPIEEALESALGFEEFTLEMGYREPIQLTIGAHLFGGFYLDYTAALGARPDYADSLYELKLSYRFKHGIELGVTTDENQALMIGVEGKLRL
ncbi:MAG TPA: translocation/assembly module TamB domain-containing protein [Armatimonadota bacterium]|nr:translocation/assembly module TamB domain-containing protein [Armatimonadota bacterium]